MVVIEREGKKVRKCLGLLPEFNYDMLAYALSELRMSYLPVNLFVEDERIFDTIQAFGLWYNRGSILLGSKDFIDYNRDMEAFKEYIKVCLERGYIIHDSD